MADLCAELALKARFVFPIGGPPLANGCVTISGQRIVAVGPAVAGSAVRDLGNVAIVPGLVNAHTHLEFSDLPAPLGQPGLPLPDWIRLVIARRRSANSEPWSGVSRGMRECLACGTTAVGEIATSDWRRFAADAAEPLCDGVMFLESLAPTPDRVAGTLAAAETFLAAARGADALRPALSPHAPYTVPPSLLDSLVELSRRFDAPLAMHLAESREELGWLQSGGGPFRDLLAAAGAGHPPPDARYASPLDYLAQLARAPRALVIHGNYLDNRELEFVAERSATMAVVYCPRTHEFFRHPPYPLARMLTMGVRVALGTDSRASNPDLSLLAEMQCVAARHPQVSAAAILELGTLAGARALGLDDQMGTLEPGKLANLAIIQLADGGAADPHALVLAPAARVAQTCLRGRFVTVQ